MGFEPKVVRHAIMRNKNYSRNAEEKLEVVKYAEKHGDAAAAKHFDTDESKSFHIAVNVNLY